jgi:DNA-binding PadR family transcriptional regulator
VRRAQTPAGSDPRGALPLTPVEIHVLLALTDDDRHGYAILQEVERRTGGALRLRTGTLYTVIKRMLDADWIGEAAGRPRRSEDDSRRRYYTLTPAGRAVVEAEARRLESVVALAREKRVLAPAGRLARERSR